MIPEREAGTRLPLLRGAAGTPKGTSDAPPPRFAKFGEGPGNKAEE